MGSWGLLESAATHDNRPECAETGAHAPHVVTAMLQNVYLFREKTAPPVEHRGDFWYWKLTPYGLDLMRALVRASAAGFSYFETFMEPDSDKVPQLILLNYLNALICLRLTHPSPQPNWSVNFNCSPYLRDQGIVIDTNAFQTELDRLIARIRRGRYDPAGNRVYPTAHQKDLEIE